MELSTAEHNLQVEARKEGRHSHALWSKQAREGWSLAFGVSRQALREVTSVLGPRPPGWRLQLQDR